MNSTACMDAISFYMTCKYATGQSSSTVTGTWEIKCLKFTQTDESRQKGKRNHQKAAASSDEGEAESRLNQFHALPLALPSS